MDLHCHLFLIMVAKVIENKDIKAQCILEHHCQRQQVQQQYYPLFCLHTSPHCPTRNSAFTALKKSTEGTDASIAFVPSPPHVQGNRGTRERKSVHYNALDDWSRIHTTAAAPAVAGCASKGTSPQEDSGSESKGGRRMGRHLVLTSRKKMHLIFLCMILMVI